MMNLFKKFFLYTPNKSDSFTLDCDVSIVSSEEKSPTDLITDCEISCSLDENYRYLQVLYNSLINSDIILRPFIISINGRNYNSLFLGIDGMFSSELVNNFLLRPLMETESKVSPTSVYTKNDIEDYIFNKLIPQNTVKKVLKFSEVSSFVNIGNCAIFVDTLNIAFIIDSKGYEARAIDTPKNEIVVRGSQEAFVERLRTNTSIIRRLINSPDLIIESTNVGSVNKTNIAICYMKNIVNSNLVSEVKYRINNIDVDYIISSGNLEQLIQDNSTIAFPQIIASERPDKAATHLLEGRVVVIVNGSPYALIMPGVFIDFLSSPEDFNLKHQYANLLKVIRLIATFITLLLPGIYVAIMNYHTELVPTALLFTIASSRNSVPFPVIVEILLMEIAFELIREAGLRIPTPIGPTIGIIGALVLGDAAVSANLVSPVLIIIVAITGICSFAIPDFSLNFTFRIYKFMYIFLGYIAGLLGIAIGLFVQVAILCNLKSFGVSYLAPYVPIAYSKSSVSLFVHPIWKRESRSSFLNTKRSQVEPPVSMKWKTKKRNL